MCKHHQQDKTDTFIYAYKSTINKNKYIYICIQKSTKGFNQVITVGSCPSLQKVLTNTLGITEIELLCSVLFPLYLMEQ